MSAQTKDVLEQLAQPSGDGSTGEGGPTRDDLHRAAGEAGIEGRSTMSKAELADALDEN